MLVLQPLPTDMALLPEGLGAGVLVASVAWVLSSPRWRLLLTLSALMAGVGVASRSTEPALVAAAIAGGMLLLLPRLGPRRFALPLCVLLVGTSYELSAAVPWLARLQYELDEFVRPVLGGLFPAEDRLLLGVGSAAWFVIPAVAISLWIVAKARVRDWLPGVLLSCLAVWWLAVLATTRLSSDLHAAAGRIPAVAGVAIVLVGAVAGRTLSRGARPVVRTRWALGLGVLVVSLLAARAATASESLSRGDAAHASVLVLDVGLQDWEVPTDGTYGGWAGGMFGLFPQHAASHGVGIARVSRTELEAALSKDVDMLMLVNLNSPLSPDELASIRGYVHAGGVCAVLADHTNVAGVMAPTNTLLEPHGIEVRFDSAKALARWPRSLATPGVGWLSAVRREGFFQYGVGASLRLSKGAVPLLRGKHAFSDRGIRGNLMGAYLGNYRVDAGEEVGDVVLVAASSHGDGEFVVIGDTSPFQNSVMPSAANGAGFLDLFLATNTSLSALPWMLFLLVFVAGLCALRYAPDPGLTVLVAGASMVLPIVVAGLNSHTRTPLRAPSPLCAVVQHGVVEGVTQNPQYRQAWSIPRSAERAGFMTRRVSGLELVPPRCAILYVLPLQTLPDQDRLIEAVRAGSEVLIVGGPRHLRAARDVLVAVRIEVRDLPLGPLPLLPLAERSLEQPRFPSSFEIRHPEDDATQVLARFDGKTVAVRRVLGAGAVTVIADDAFPQGGNVEGMKTWHLGNLTFLSRYWALVRRQLSAGP